MRSRFISQQRSRHLAVYWAQAALSTGETSWNKKAVLSAWLAITPELPRFKAQDFTLDQTNIPNRDAYTRQAMGRVYGTMITLFVYPTKLTVQTLADWLLTKPIIRFWSKQARIRGVLLVRQQMSPPRFDVPPIATLSELAEFLELTPQSLTTLANARYLNVSTSELTRIHTVGDPASCVLTSRYSNYVVHLEPKKSGGQRVIEAPKRRLKQVQRRILNTVLRTVPTHQAAHGFIKGRSTRTGAEPHVGRAMIMSFDLADFFPSIALRRIAGLFGSLGYPMTVAKHLALLCTTSQRLGLRLPFPERQMYAARHLPQGAPTSPCLSNLVCFRLDQRLSGLAKHCHGTYTRYADDLTLSFAERPRNPATLVATVQTICLEEGFVLRTDKTRIKTRGQAMDVLGLVTNDKLRPAKRSIKLLEATLMSTIKVGVATANREGHPDFLAHLRGQIAWVAQFDGAWGEYLMTLWQRVVTNQSAG